MEPIKHQSFSDPDRLRVHEQVISAVETDPEPFIERYRAFPQSFGGRYVNSDLFKETFDQYRASKESRNRYNVPVHNAAAVLASEQFRRVLQLAPEPGRDTVVLLTGVPGAGKTSSVLERGQLLPHIHAVFEGQLAAPETTLAKVQQVLDAGFRPAIMVIHPRPEQALDNTLKRFNTEGRGSSLHILARIMSGLPDGLAAVRDKFGDQVHLRVMDRRADFSNPGSLVGWQQLPVLQSEGSYEQIRARLERHLETRRGDISTEAWRQAAGQQPGRPEPSRPDGVAGRERPETLARSQASGRSRADAVLSRSGPQRNPWRPVEPLPEVPDNILDGLAANAALAHLDRHGLEALRDAGEGKPLNPARHEALRGWNGPLYDAAADRLTRLGEMAYSLHTQQLAVPERQARDLSQRERDAMAQQQQQQNQFSQQQLQARNIAQREEERNAAEKLARKIEHLKAIEAQAQASNAPEPVKQEIVQQAREQQQDLVRQAPRQVRSHLPKRDRGLDR